ncbi:hypothetical protein CsSME_00040351 [Camellia sinensis var. sinensis]
MCAKFRAKPTTFGISGRPHLEFNFHKELLLPRAKSGSNSKIGNPIGVLSSPTSFSCLGGLVRQVSGETDAFWQFRGVNTSNSSFLRN